MTNLIETAQKSAAVAQVSAWKDRHYVTLTGANARANGDRSAKIWIKGSVLTVEGGKGSYSSEFLASLETLRADLEAAGAARVAAWTGSVDATYTLS